MSSGNNACTRWNAALRLVLSACIAIIAFFIVTETRIVLSADDPIKLADDAFKAKDYGQAADKYREVFINNRKGPIAENALFGMARADFKLKRYTEARLNMQRFLLYYPQSPNVNDAFFFLGYIFLYEHKLGEARQYFDKVGGSLKPKADIGRIEVALGHDDIAGAEAILKTVDGKELQRNPRALYVRAAILSRKGMQKEAVSVITKVLDAVLKEEDLRVEKAAIYLNASRLEDAGKLCEAIIADPVSSTEKYRAERILASIYERKDRVDDALKLYIDVIPFDPSDNIKMSLARLYDRKGDAVDALRYVSLLKDKRTKSAEMEKRLKQLMDNGNPDAADYILKFSMSLDKDSPFIVTAAKYLIEKGRKHEGEFMLKRAETGVEKGEAALSLARTFYNEGNYNEARKNITPLLLENRYFLQASFMTADIMAREGDLQGAIACLEKASKYSKDARISGKLADLFFDTGDRVAAFKYYKAASEGGIAIASLKTADLLFLAGKVSQSGPYYRRALDQGLSDDKSLQWARYQYGKISGSNELLKKAADSGGIVGEAAGIVAGRKQ